MDIDCPSECPACEAAGLLPIQKLRKQNETLIAALEGLVQILDSAGLLNLSNGVQLGQTSWYVKASDRLEAARAALTAAKGGSR